MAAAISRPALAALAEDPRVTAAVVITDGDIAYPADADALCRAVGRAGRHHHVRAALWAGRHMQREERAMKVVQELVTYFDRAGSCRASSCASCSTTNQVAADAPTSMHGLCDVTGAVYYFRITGVAEGQVWGSGHLHARLVLGAAAVHAGLLKPGETAVLRVTVVPPLPSYKGTTRNGVTTTDYADFPHCWELSAI